MTGLRTFEGKSPNGVPRSTLPQVVPGCNILNGIANLMPVAGPELGPVFVVYPHGRSAVNRLILIIVALFLLSAGAVFAADAAPGYVMRYADIGGGQIVFTYEGDLWLVPETGGDARRITSHPGTETGGQVQPDGTKLAFTGELRRRQRRLRHGRHGRRARAPDLPPGRRHACWTGAPTSTGVVFRSNRRLSLPRHELYRVSVDGGMPMRLPAGPRLRWPRSLRTTAAWPTTASAAQTRTWKRYEGGMAQDIWVEGFRQRRHRARSPTGPAPTTSPCGTADRSTSPATARTAR